MFQSYDVQHVTEATFLRFSLGHFPNNLGEIGDEHGERFHQDVSTVGKGSWEDGTVLCVQNTVGL